MMSWLPGRGARRTAALTAGLAVAALCSVGPLAGPAAAADPCTAASCTTGGSGNTLTVAVNVTLTGDGVGGGGGGGSTVTVQVPPVCYWFDNTVNMGGQSLAELKADSYQGPSRMGANDAIWDNPPDGWWAQYDLNDPNLHAYEPTCNDGNSYSGGSLTMLDAYGRRTSPYGLFIGTVGSQPQPVIDPSVLKEAAYNAMTLGDPALSHNPDIGILGGGTLVGLDTYFWVTDPNTLGANGNGRRTVRATALGVWAEVTATTDGATITSPDATRTCSRAQLLTRYPSTGSYCVVVFSHASTGYPVSASSTWQVAFRLSDGSGGDMPAKVAGPATVTVPVGESQALVGIR